MIPRGKFITEVSRKQHLNDSFEELEGKNWWNYYRIITNYMFSFLLSSLLVCSNI